MGDVTPLSSENTTYLIEDVSPGLRQIAVYPQAGEGWRYWHPIEVSASVEPTKVTLDIPHGSASVSGTFSSSFSQSLTLWTLDRSITANIYPPGEPYSVEDLPAGRYMIGNVFVGEMCPLVEFDLADGEHRIVDLDTAAWPDEIGFLTVYVVNSRGCLLNHAEAWLEGASGRREPCLSSTSAVCGFYAYKGIHSLIVQCEGYQDHAEPVTIEPYKLHAPGQEKQEIVVRMKPL
jgi:hypothetical protein